jgi:DNA-binding HxlR family transcriptional regulator
MDKELLDEHCKDIFSLLLVSSKPLRFNDLRRSLNTLGLKMTTPTVSKHLRHLRARKMIIREKIGKQNVSYKVN